MGLRRATKSVTGHTWQLRPVSAGGRNRQPWTHPLSYLWLTQLEQRPIMAERSSPCARPPAALWDLASRAGEITETGGRGRFGNRQDNPGAGFAYFGAMRPETQALREPCPLAATVTCVGRHTADEMVRPWGIRKHRGRAVPNPVDALRSRRLADNPPPHPWLSHEVPNVMGDVRLHPIWTPSRCCERRAMCEAGAQRPVTLAEEPAWVMLESRHERLFLRCAS